MARPRTGPAWVIWVNEMLRKLEGRRWVQVPVGGMVLYPTAGLTELDEQDDWLLADGSTFSDDPDDVDDLGYPDLADALGGTTLPDASDFSPPTGWTYIVRVE